MQKIIVTTGRKISNENISMAQNAANFLNLQYIPRENVSIETLKDLTNSNAVLIAKKKQFILHTNAGEMFFHPSMAHLRIKNLRLGKNDNMIEAMGLEKGMSVLDCTLGMGADSIVAAFATGIEGQVVSLEINPVIAYLISYGMQHTIAENYDIHSAMRRINIINTDYLPFLKKQLNNSFDIIYFDPMFRHPIKTSSHLNPLREISDHSPLSPEAISEAIRVAKKKVVMKENSKSKEFSRLGFHRIVGGRYSSINYGIIHV